ncbi:MAG: DNA-processing protein DprA [Flavobacteriales bacterium]
MEHKQQLYQIAFSQLYGIGPIRARRILKLLEHPKDFFELNFNVLQQLTSIPIAQLEKTDRNGALLRAQSQLPFLSKENVSYHFITDTSYPTKLKHCPDAPLGLFYRGQEPQWQKSRSIAIVGTRQQTNYGKTLVEKLLSELPKDILVISGLAKGVDAHVHEQCIRNGLQTIGVLGHGIDRIYPAANRMLAEQMLTTGGLLSEFLIGTAPDRMHFPMRNRIIAGLADAVVVIESNKNGGSLITADLANDYNREVFAFPGPVSQLQSEGCHDLIKNQQAHLLTGAQDLLNAMNWSSGAEPQTPHLHPNYSELQKELITLFKLKNSWSIDEIALNTSQAVSKISSALFELEINGILQNKGGNRYSLPL